MPDDWALKPAIEVFPQIAQARAIFGSSEWADCPETEHPAGCPKSGGMIAEGLRRPLGGERAACSDPSGRQRGGRLHVAAAHSRSRQRQPSSHC